MGIGTILGGIALGAGQGILDNTAGYYTQKNLNRQARNDYRRNLKLSQQLNIEAQRKAIEQSTSALKNAGLSPALAAQGNFSAPSASAPLGQSSAPNPNFDFSSSIAAVKQAQMLESEKENLSSQTELNEAAANKAKAEAKSIEINNRREATKDSLVSKSTLDVLAAMREETDSPFIRGFIEEFENGLSADDMNLGLLDSFQQVFYELSQKERDRELDFLVKEFDKRVYQEQFNNGSVEAIADLPKATRYQIYRNCALMLAQIGQLNAETSLTEDKRNLIRSNVAKLGQEVQSLLHHDPAAMWHSGDLSGVLAMLGYDAVKAAANGVGFGAGAAIGSRVGGSAAGAYATKATTPISSMSREQVHRQLELSRNEIKALKTAKESAARNKRLGELYKENKDLLDRLKSFGSTDYMR